MINFINSPNTALETLSRIKAAINSNERILPIDAKFYFTKGKPGRTQGYLLRDIELENDVKHWLETRVSLPQVLSRYKSYFPILHTSDWPKHYAARFVNLSGKGKEGKNIFMFFPEVLGLQTGQPEDYFGFEFIDMWVSVFDEIIFPCMRKIFDLQSQIQLFSILRPNLERTIYLASVFHELGHQSGPWRVSPSIDPKIKINKFHTDVLGELATDTLMINFIKEFPELLYFIFLQRIFWFGRFGFKDNVVHGKLNEDNDTWIGAYLWNKYTASQALTQLPNNKWQINFEKLGGVFDEVTHDLDSLGETIINEHNQDELISSWMRARVELVDNKFLLPQSLISVYSKCKSIAEYPIVKF